MRKLLAGNGGHGGRWDNASFVDSLGKVKERRGGRGRFFRDQFPAWHPERRLDLTHELAADTMRTGSGNTVVRPNTWDIVVDLFPHDWDYAWLAIDAVGHVGLFTNAGEGPIPAAALVDRSTSVRTERLVKGLPARGSCKILISLPRPDDFIAFAQRGLFAYDWQDVHRTCGRLNCYELLARPDVPLSVEELDEEIEMLARRVQFESLLFGESYRIAVPEHVNC